MKTAVVTAGSRGIGLGVVRMLVGRGYRVLASFGHDMERASQAEREWEGEVCFFQADHTERSQTYAFADFVKQQTNSIHCVVCNAGITVRKDFLHTTDADWDAMMEVGVNAHFVLLRELYPLVADGARILFTGSTVAAYPHATVLGYGTSKTALHGMAKNLVKVFAEKHATVNVIAPGFVETDWQKEKPEHIRNSICQKTAIHRFATIEEVVSAYAFCLDNDFVNGTVVEVNGGYSYQ